MSGILFFIFASCEPLKHIIGSSSMLWSVFLFLFFVFVFVLFCFVLFCFVLFCFFCFVFFCLFVCLFFFFWFFIHKFSKIYETTLIRYKLQNEAKKRKKKKEKKRKDKKRENGEGGQKSTDFANSCTKKNARRPATDLILLSNPAPKYVLILDYRCLSHLLKIYFLNIFDVVSS